MFHKFIMSKTQAFSSSPQAACSTMPAEKARGGTVPPAAVVWTRVLLPLLLLQLPLLLTCTHAEWKGAAALSCYHGCCWLSREW